MSDRLDKPLSRREFLKLSLAAGGGALVDKIIPSSFSEIHEKIESANEVSFRPDHIALVNGKPLFPLGIFYLPSANDTTIWRRIKQAGINTISCWWINNQSISSAESSGLYTVAYTDYAFPTYDTGPDIQIIKRLAQSKSLLAWYGVDEPDVGLRKDRHTRWFNQLGEIDPHHPLWINYFDFPGNLENSGQIPFEVFKENYPGNKLDLSGMPATGTMDDFIRWSNNRYRADISGFDVGWTKFAGPEFKYGDMERRYYQNLHSYKLGIDAKAFWMILSAHSEVPHTYESLRYQFWEAYTHGATGIFFWDWPPGCTAQTCPTFPGKGNGYSAHWGKIEQITKEANHLHEAISANTIFLGTNKTGIVSYKVTQHANHFYVFATSNHQISSSSSVESIISPANTEFEVIGENRQVTSGPDGYLLDTYADRTVHIYRATIPLTRV